MTEPAVLKMEPGMEEKFKEEYEDCGAGVVGDMKALLSLEEIIAEGPSYLYRMYNQVLGEEVCKPTS